MFDFNEVHQHSGTNSWKWDQYGDPSVIALANADMDFKSAPNIIDALRKTADYGYFNYHFKPQDYYEIVQKWYKRRQNWDIDQSWLLNAPGIWPALQICVQTFTEKGDYIITQSPRFHPLLEVAERDGRKIIENPMVLKSDRYELDFEDFEEKIIQYKPKIFWLINLQNPTGRVFSKEELLKLNDICTKYNVLTISDEVHGIALFNGKELFPAPSISDQARNNSIVVTAASKAYNLMDLTFCLMVVPNPELREKIQSMLIGYSLDFAVNCFSVASVTSAFSEETDEWLDANVKYLYENMEYAAKYFEENIPQIKPIRPEGSFVMWLDCHGLNMSDTEMRDFFVNKAKVGLTWGDGYGKEGSGFERINFGCPRATLEEGLKRIKDAVEKISIG